MLTEIIDQSYRLFSKYHSTGQLEVCTYCCMTPEAAANLASSPVRQIPKDLLAEYNDSAKPDKTTIKEVKHFLPRYLDLIGKFDFPTHSTELSFSRLTPFEKNEWTNEELALLNQFANEYFRLCLSTYPIPSFNDRIDTILIMFSKGGFQVNDLLTIWETQKTKESVLHFRDLHFHGFQKFNQTKLFNAFGDKELAVKLRSWLDSATVKQNFSEAIEQLIIEDNDLEQTDLYELSILYDINQIDKNVL